MKGRFRLSKVLQATPKEIYVAWLSSDGHTAMTGSPAKVEALVGSPFTAWDGYITGTTLELEPYSRFVQTWRTSEFSDADPDSKIEVTLKPAAAGTKLTLIHSEIPQGQAESYKSGWEEWYFKPMRAYFQE